MPQHRAARRIEGEHPAERTAQEDDAVHDDGLQREGEAGDVGVPGQFELVDVCRGDLFQGAEVFAAEAPAVDEPVLAGAGLVENACLGHVPEARLGGGLIGACDQQHEYRRQDDAQARN